ncbi:MAG TPA: FAD-dependent oxidoreductase [Noviherbaspirillum sp.]|jgi:2-polyprenyl-6-methoxyphenol hydroxylase-like FAD-dependent oxidoreductase|uniref:NAD(P)/FAD-dependent oxidoreductase n=1 Tax=Noviherbaspirillum sp. TaxID=1926288 RepID=UPI002DDCD665|nr:FAD-dependent oxidoreductase [Noviherbaspirillum sp.]HEV2612738.1 FAD-dependent oxidoreductase [Noviherbaspirillum sp.]
MTTHTHYDAIIIGAGPAGASAAILLSRQGWRVAVVEKQRFPRRKVCGECIAASNLPLLDELGIGKAVADLAGAPLRQVALMMGEQTVRAPFPAFADGRHPWGVALGREVLDTLLLEQAARSGADVFQPWAARSIDGGPGAYRCHVGKVHADESVTLQAPVLIAAHGSWELPPAGTRQDQDGQQKPQQLLSDLFAFKANFTDAGLETGLLPVLSFPGGYGGMVVGDSATTTLAFCMRRDQLLRCRQAAPAQKAAEAAVAHVARTCAGVRRMLSTARQQGTWLAVGPIRPGIRMPRDGGSAFLVGNAAGEAHPIIGEGMSMAIQSACLLAGLLGPHRTEMKDAAQQAALRQGYAQMWHGHFAQRIRLAALFAHAAMRPGLTGAALPVLRMAPHLLTRAAQWSGKVTRAPVPMPATPNALNTDDLLKEC